jgi:uncharacterized protein DUF1615
MSPGRCAARALRRILSLSCVALVVACSTPPPAPVPTISPADARALIARLLPAGTSDARGWAADIYAAFAVQDIAATAENVCAVVAVIEQESGFRADPAVAGLPAIAWAEIDRRAEQAGVPPLVVHAALRVASSNGVSYGERIDHVRTERELSDIFEDFIGMVPLGRRLFAGSNPIRTRGPMQVNVAFAERFVARHPYPYPVQKSIADELFTRRGGLFFGIGHLLDYPAAYDRYLFRFADFNAGQYASRNAAFQNALAIASGIPIVADGALQTPGSSAPGSTELAARTLAAALRLSDGEIRAALEQGRSKDFEHTALYQRVFARAERIEGHSLPRALVPRIELQGPKLTRHLTTAWYADSVDAKFRRCLLRQNPS